MQIKAFEFPCEVAVKGQQVKHIEAREPTVNDLVEVAKRNLHPAEAEVAYIAIAVGSSEEEVRTWPRQRVRPSASVDRPFGRCGWWGDVIRLTLILSRFSGWQWPIIAAMSASDFETWVRAADALADGMGRAEEE